MSYKKALEKLDAEETAAANAHAAEIAAAEERGRLQGQFSPLGDNHHNAAACPYCRGLLTKAEERGRQRGLEEAARWHEHRAAIVEIGLQRKVAVSLDDDDRKYITKRIAADRDDARLLRAIDNESATCGPDCPGHPVSDLAPRDSAPVCWKCGAPYKRPDVCDYCLAPRDSAPKRDPYVEAGVDDWGAPRDPGKEG